MSTLPHAWIVRQTSKISPDRFVGAAADQEAAEDLARIDRGDEITGWIRDDTSSTVDLAAGTPAEGYLYYVALRQDLWTSEVPGPDEPTSVRRLSLAEAAEEFREANTRANAARDALRDAVLRELAAEHPEAAVARTAGVDRMTVRRWAGK
jgi:hypothetical protein